MHRSVIYSALIGLLLTYGAAAQSIEQTMEAGAESMRSGAYGQAITRFSRVLAREPHNFEAQFNLGLAYLNSGRYQEALKELTKAAGIDQRNSEVWGAMGYAYEKLGSREQAISAFSKAVNLDPGNIQARLNLASMYLTYNRPNEAINQYKQIVQIDGQNAFALLHLGKCLINAKQFAEAKGYLRMASAADPGNIGAEAHWELGNILWKQEHKPDDAQKEYEKAIRLRSDGAVFYESLGRLLEDQNKKSEALEVYRKSLVYTDDALRKEEIQKRIDRIENPDSDKGDGKSDKSFTRRDRGDLETLKKEVRGQETRSEVKTMDVGSLKIKTDLSDFTSDDAGFDLKEEAKKRSSQK